MLYLFSAFSKFNYKIKVRTELFSELSSGYIWQWKVNLSKIIISVKGQLNNTVLLRILFLGHFWFIQEFTIQPANEQNEVQNFRTEHESTHPPIYAWTARNMPNRVAKTTKWGRILAFLIKEPLDLIPSFL